jgi:suppressor of ftsI
VTSEFDQGGSENGRTVTRRAFLIGGGVAVGTGLYAAFRAVGDRGASSPGSTATTRTLAMVDDWLQPPTRTSSAGQLATNLRVTQGTVPIGTTMVEALTYEHMYPGPTLEIQAGDRLVVDLINDGSQITNVHTHGLHVSPRSPADNVFVAVHPGNHYRYEYQVPEDHPAGTYWYHAHWGMLTDVQVFGGLFGTLIVRGELDRLPGIAGLPERVMVLSQIQVTDGAIVEGDMSPLDQQLTLVNGLYKPTIDATPGETQRWRLVNASSVFYRLQLEGHSLAIIGIDGNPATAVTPTSILEIPPGGRADVLVTPKEAGAFPFRSLSWKSFGIFYSTGMVPVAQTLVMMQTTSATTASTVHEEANRTALVGSGVGNASARAPRVDAHRSGPHVVASAPVRPTTLLPFEDLRDVPITRRRVFQFAEREPRGTGQLDKFQYFINGRQFNPWLVNDIMLLGSVEEWHLVNLTYEPHPVHIHVNPFQVIERNGTQIDENFYRDTVELPPFGSLTLRTRFADFVGIFVWHCHILFHEDNGMMRIAEVVADEDEMHDGGPRWLTSGEYFALQRGLTGSQAPV